MQKTSHLQHIKYADRTPIKNTAEIIEQLNILASQSHHDKLHISWDIGSDSLGQALHAKITFKMPNHCIEFITFISDLQETTDHHANLTMNNFMTVDILLSTHQPIPGITMVDVEFARCMSTFQSTTSPIAS